VSSLERPAHRSVDINMGPRSWYHCEKVVKLRAEVETNSAKAGEVPKGTKVRVDKVHDLGYSASDAGGHRLRSHVSLPRPTLSPTVSGHFLSNAHGPLPRTAVDSQRCYLTQICEPKEFTGWCTAQMLSCISGQCGEP
jgi:hypothetical protein